MKKTGNNRGYDKEVFTVSTERKEIALLPGIGKFCKCGCGKRIEGVRVTRKLKSSTISYYRQPPINKEFATQNCARKYFSKYQQRQDADILRCIIILRVNADKAPYRKMTIYHKKGIKTDLKITQKDKELWSYLERISRYSGNKTDHESIIVPNIIK